MRIAEITLLAFIDDTRVLVSEGVRKDISDRISAAVSDVDRNAKIKYGAEREDHLKQWLSEERPLSYSDDFRTGAFVSLLGAVMPSHDQLHVGLPNFEENYIAPSDFVKLLLDMSAPRSSPRARISPVSPVVKNGSFFPLLKEAHSKLLSLAPQDDDDFVSRIFKLVVEHLKIRFVPASPASSGRSGRRITRPVFNSWSQLGRPDSPLILEAITQARLPTASERVVSQVFEKVVASDSNADWAAKKLTLNTLRTVLKKTRLPTDFRVITKFSEEYVEQTYVFVRQHYDGTKPLHHLALLIGIVVSNLLPRLFVGDCQRSDFAFADTPDKVLAVYQTKPWVERPNKKGLTDKSIFIAMVTTFIIAIYEPSSPLRKHIAESQRHGLGDAWTYKHSELFLSSFSSSYLFFSIAVKGLSYTTFIRLGIFWGKSYGAFDKGTYGADWGCHDLTHIEYIYNTLVTKLEEQPHGPYDALSFLIGEHNARDFAKHLGLVVGSM